MVKIFISYSRVDTDFLKDIYPLLGRMYQFENVWYDDWLHGGDNWWETILEKIAWCDVFIYLLSNESVTSEYCQAEFQEAQRLGKFIITIQVRDRTKLDSDLSGIQYIDMKPGVDEADAIARLFAAIGRVDVNAIRKKRARWKGQTPKPGTVTDAKAVARPDVDTPPLTATLPAVSTQPEKRKGLSEPIAIIIAAVITGSFAVIAAWIAIGGGNDETPTPTLEPTTVIAQADSVEDATDELLPTETPSDIPTETSTATITPSNTPTATNAPSDTPVPTVVPTSTSHPALALAKQDVITNGDWEPYTTGFNGIAMALVPKGCFRMGNNLGDENERPAQLFCLDEPFWVDAFEVYNQQFNNLNGEAGRESRSTDTYLPRESITWREALEFCQSRGARLPTEAEWEYAARGPSGYLYPWGNEIDFARANTVEVNFSGTVEITRYQSGRSWVGAYNMSGNVFEWVSTIYDQERYPYPYNPDDGRENLP